MIREAYCSFEVSKLLKEKGFDEPCAVKYCTDGSFSRSFHHYKNSEINKDAYCAPTHQKARRWLREVHYIYADPIKQGNYNDCSDYYTWIVARMGIIHRNSSVIDKLSYEEAVEAALEYALENLI